MGSPVDAGLATSGRLKKTEWALAGNAGPSVVLMTPSPRLTAKVLP